MVENGYLKPRGIQKVMWRDTKFVLSLEVIVTPQTRGSVDYPSTRGIQVDVGLPDATSENRVESPLYGELYPHTVPAYICPKKCNISIT